MHILLAIILGGFFGYSLYIVGATNFKEIGKMLRLEDLTLAKIILFAIGLSSVLLFLANLVGIFDISHLNIKPMNLGVITGAVIFGVGFGVSGTCPGTSIGGLNPQTYKKAISAILGGLLGAFAFTLSYEFFDNLGLFNILDYGKLALFNLSDKYPSIFNIGFSGLLITGLLFIVLALIMPNSIIKYK